MFGETMCPAASFDDLRREMNRLFGSRFGQTNGGTWPRPPRTYPPLNVWEEGDRIMVEAEVPGLSMNDIDVQVVGNELTIKGERKPFEGQNVTFHRQERGTGSFVRTLALPVEVNADKVEAVLRDGVLTITLPKSEQAKARKINVKSA
jgi:HSP20 family protein